MAFSRKPTCFIVMPYGRRPVKDLEVDFDAIYDGFIAPAVVAAGYKVMRSDRDQASGVIMPAMFKSIQEADLLIADVTAQNPNVYYELGLRHALCRHGTMLIRRAGGDFGVRPLPDGHAGVAADTAFDIKDVTALPYELHADRLDGAVAALRKSIEQVGDAVRTDSPAYLYLEGLKVTTGVPLAHVGDDRTYEILIDDEPCGRFVGYRSGDLKDLRDERAVDYWVNSENVLMQMARVYERSVSSTIRHLGALQPDPATAGFDDTIAVDLARQLGARRVVDQGEVLVTTSGRLRHTHGVKAILHAAVVTGAPGRGFEPIAESLLPDTTRNVLAAARRLARGGGDTAGRTLAMPLFGTGQGRRDPDRITGGLLQETMQCLAQHADRGPEDLTHVFFSTFTKAHVSLMQRLLEQAEKDGQMRRVDDRPAAGNA